MAQAELHEILIVPDETDAIERAIGKSAKLLRKSFGIDQLLEAVNQATEGP